MTPILTQDNVNIGSLAVVNIVDFVVNDHHSLETGWLFAGVWEIRL